MDDQTSAYIPPPRGSGSGIAVAIVVFLLLLPVGLFAIRFAIGKLRAPPTITVPATAVPLPASPLAEPAGTIFEPVEGG